MPSTAPAAASTFEQRAIFSNDSSVQTIFPSNILSLFEFQKAPGFANARLARLKFLLGDHE